MSKKSVRIKLRPKSKIKANVSAIGQALRTLGGLGGAALGGMVGNSAAGSAIGNGLGATLSRWLGQGDYTVTNNSLVLKASQGIPEMHRNGQSIIVRHKEYLGQIDSSTTYLVRQSYVLNPGLASTFPWLSSIASNFQEYTFKGVVFHYVPTSGHAITGTNPAIGSVMMQTSYRSTDTPPSSKIELLNEYFACEAAPDTSFVHPIECDPKENPFNVQYVRTGALPPGETQLMYDLGTTYVAVNGNPATGNTVGDIWVSYEVELRKPILHSNVTRTAYLFGSTRFGAGITVNDYFPTSLTPVVQGNLPLTLSGRTITFPAGTFGEFYIQFYLTSDISGFSGATVTIPGTITTVNCVSSEYGTSGSNVLTTSSFGATQVSRLFWAANVVKSAAETVATVTLPSANISTGVIANSSILVYGTGEPE